MRRVYTVAELTGALRRLIEQQFGQVWVGGEITNLRAAAGADDIPVHVVFQVPRSNDWHTAAVIAEAFNDGAWPGFRVACAVYGFADPLLQAFQWMPELNDALVKILERRISLV